MGNLFQGYREGNQDWNTYSFDLPVDLTPSGGAVYANYGINVINFSGTGSVGVVLPSGIEGTTNFVYIKDGFGGAAGANIVISGASTSQKIDGANSTTISTAYGFKHLYNYSGTAWITL